MSALVDTGMPKRRNFNQLTSKKGEGNHWFGQVHGRKFAIPDLDGDAFKKALREQGG